MPPQPPAPPTRTIAGHYHFHTYDYNNSAANGPWGLSPAQPSRGGLRFYSMRQDLRGLYNYGVYRGIPGIALNDLGAQTENNRRTMVLSIGNQGTVANRPTVVITGGIHAREWIAAEMTYLIAEYLIRNYPVGMGPFTARQNQIRTLVDSRNIRIIPMVNPDGNDRTVFGGGPPDGPARFWRKNLRSLPYWGVSWVSALAPNNVPNPPLANVQYETFPIYAQYRVTRWDPGGGVPANAWPGIPAGVAVNNNHVLPNLETGVDLNRNMATTGWGYDNFPNYRNWNPVRESYFGTRRGGEPETGNVQTAMNAAALAGPGHIDVSIDYHCYGMLILYPGEANPATFAPLHTATGTMLQNLIVDAAGINGYQLGDPRAVIGYDGTGSVMDYAAQQHASRAFTIELDPDLPAPGETEQQQLQRFALPENQIMDVFEKNIRGALAAMAVPATALEANNFAAATWNWNVFGQGNQLP